MTESEWIDSLSYEERRAYLQTHPVVLLLKTVLLLAVSAALWAAVVLLFL